jgi:hypothetical protein
MTLGLNSTPILKLSLFSLSGVVTILGSFLGSLISAINVSLKFGKFGVMILLQFVELIGVSTDTSIKISLVALVTLTVVSSVFVVVIALCFLKSAEFITVLLLKSIEVCDV